jgi:lysophospholipase L1-like esterase
MIRTITAPLFALFIGSASSTAFAGSTGLVELTEAQMDQVKGGTSAQAFGDSFTAGHDWFALLDLNGNNFAVSGAAASSAFANPSSNTFAKQVQRWHSAGEPGADAVIVFIGINDILGATTSFSGSRAAYTKALKELSAADGPLVLVKAPDLGAMPDFKGTSEAAALTKKTVTWNKFVGQQANAFGAKVVDLFKKLSSPSLIGSDGLHPNSRGQQVIANAIKSKL